MFSLILSSLKNIRWWLMGGLVLSNIVCGLLAYTYHLKLDKLDVLYSQSVDVNKQLSDSLDKQKKSCFVTESILSQAISDAEGRKDMLTDLLNSIDNSPRSLDKPMGNTEVAGHAKTPETPLKKPSNSGFLSDSNYRLLQTATCQATNNTNCPSTIP